MEVIELTGPTGCGKTTLVPMVHRICGQFGLQVFTAEEAVLECIRNSLWIGKVLYLVPKITAIDLAKKVYGKIVKKKYIARFILHNDLFYNEVRRIQDLRKIPWNDREIIIEWFLSLGGRYQFFGEKLREEETVIFDEGFVQKVASLFVSETEDVSSELIIKYLDMCPKGNLIIKINTDLTVCSKRLKSRGLTPRVADKSHEELHRFISNSEKTVNIATQYLYQKGAEIIEINNSHTLKEVYDNLRSLLYVYFEEK